jgi:hypothetical protein
LKSWLGEHYNLRDVTDLPAFLDEHEVLGEHYNLRDVTARMRIKKLGEHYNLRNKPPHKQLLVEKRIAQLSSNIEVIFAFDLIKTKHVEKRKDFNKRGLNTDERWISNQEMSEVVGKFKKDIATAIFEGDIVDGTNFVIKDYKFGLSMAIIAEKSSETYWKLIIKTVFRETPEHTLEVGRNQLVFEK